MERRRQRKTVIFADAGNQKITHGVTVRTEVNLTFWYIRGQTLAPVFPVK
jgi:hypothetical protein